MLELAASPGLSATVRPAQYAQALMFASQIAQLQGDNAGAHRLIEASVALWRTLDDPLGLAWALTNSSSDHLIRGEFDRGEALVREAVALAKTVAEPFTLSSVLASLGLALIVRGQPEQAASHIREGIAVGQTVERVSLREFALTRAMAWLGRAESERGAGDAAIQVFKDALAQLRHLRVTGYLFGFCLAWMADAIAHTGEPERAARLFGAAEAQIRRAGVTTNPTMKLSPRDGLRRAQAQLGPDAYTRAWNEGHAMDVAQVFAYALDEPA
jgi:ATP/maltotriose-dependent transcriptional regulator MalT